MGFYVNPGNKSFKEDLNCEIFVDKTMLLSELNARIGTSDKFVCVSRPRRFGKTRAERMMSAYYSKGCDSSDLFAGLKIASDSGFDRHLNKYNVLHLDINAFWSENVRKALTMMRSEVTDEFRKEFPDVAFPIRTTIEKCIRLAYEASGIPFVIIIDEYDVIFRDEDAASLVKDYLKLLNALFKSDSMSGCIALAYITGIFPIIREKAQSKLNNFTEFTFLNPGRFAEFTGFTESDVKKLCDRYGMGFAECRSWYDGYKLEGIDVYAPRSVVSAMQNGKYMGYWNQTSTFRVVRDAIALDIDRMRPDVEAMIAGSPVPLNISRFENDPARITSRDDVFTYLCHLGYLAYDVHDGTCRIPNREIRDEWVNALEDFPDDSGILKMIRESKLLLEAVWNGDGYAAAASLERAHEHLTSPLSYNNEKSFQSAIRLAFFYADRYYTIISECPSGKGYADLVFIPYKPNIPAMIVELKLKGTKDTAIDQIRSMRYFAGLEKYAGNTLLVGAAYDRKTKKHECTVESV